MNKQQIANQRVFDEALKHIRKQGQPSIRARHSKGGALCRYHGPNKLMCAFAPAIKNYTPEMEGKGAYDLLEDFSDALHEWARDANPYVCYDIQCAHDINYRLTGPAFLTEFEADMRSVAKKHNLTYTEAE